MHEDRIRQVVTPEVDVLFIVDNSCSMWEQQSALTANFPVFMDYFLGSDLDYHIGVVSTDVYDPAHSGRLRQVAGHRYLRPDTPNASSLFTEMALLGTSGHWDERGFQATEMAIEVEGDHYNQGFFRDAASLHVVVISDEDDHSPGSPSEFGGWLRSQRGGGRVSFSSVVAPPEGCPQAVEPGLRYLQVTRAGRGVEWSICTSNWVGLLEELGLHASGLTQEYFLSRRPVVETLRVRATEGTVEFDFLQGEDFTYDPVRNSVFLHHYVPEANAEIVLRYRVVAGSG